MNDFELDKSLKSLSVPERAEDYWEGFPSQVRGRLRRPPAGFAPRDTWRPQFAWAGGLALVIALVFVCVEFHPVRAASLALTKQQRHFHAQLARLDTGLHRLMLNTGGMGYLLTETD
jgi:hypothetical protein